MKRRFWGVLLALVLVLSLSLVTAVPMATPAKAATTFNVAAYTLGPDTHGTSVWSTAQSPTGSASVLLTHTDGTGSVYVDFVPPAGETLATFQADITAATPAWSFRHFLENTGVTNGPQFELRFTESGGTGWLEVTAVGLQGTTGTAGWLVETLAGATLAGYGGNTPDGSSVFEWGPLTALSGIEDAVNASWETAETGTNASAYVLTRVRVELWEDIDQYCHIDDITIAGVTYYGLIQDAVDSATASDTITVAAGTYAEEITVDKNLTITCTATCTITGDVHFNAASITMTDATLDTGYEWYVDSETASIQDAIDAASDDDTINVAAGNYTPASTLTINNKGLTLKSIADATTTTIDVTALGDEDWAAQICEDGVTIEGFTFSLGGSRGILVTWEDGCGPMTGITIQDNIIVGTGSGTGVLLMGQLAESPQTVIDVLDNQLERRKIGLVNVGSSTISGNTLTGGGYIDFAGSCTGDNITGNNITGAPADKGAISFSTFGPPETEYATILIEDNILSNNLGCGIKVPFGRITSVTISENDISGNADDGIEIASIVTFGAASVIQYNDIYDNTNYGINNGTSTSVDAQYNYWGDPSGPDIDTASDSIVVNDRGIGDDITTYVDYEPWLHTTQATVVAANTRYYAYNLVSLQQGWNIWSTPIAPDSQADTWGEYKVLGVDLDLASGSTAYFFNASTPGWESVTDSYVLRPCDAIYIKMASAQVSPILFSPSVSAPSKMLYPGWNLVSASYFASLDVPALTSVSVEIVLASVYYATGASNIGYSVVTSPAVNQTAWSGVREAAIDTAFSTPDMIPTEGYWVHMVNGGTLVGAVFTPVSPLLP